MTSPAAQVRAFRARWVFPVQTPPIRDGVVAVAGPHIVYVGSPTRDYQPVDLGDVAILPGLVNAHTHLEFSELEAPVGRAGMPLPDWIGAVVQYRGDRDAQRADAPAHAIRRGMAECLRQGVTTIGEIATSDWPVQAVASLPAEGIVFRELLGMSPERIEVQRRIARSHLDAFPQGAAWRPGLSPHAPYSVHPDLLESAVSLAQTTGAALAMHLAESWEEIELLAAHRGPFVSRLEQLNAWHPGTIPVGWRPMNFLRMLARTPRVLVVHGNYLADDEIEFLGAWADRMSVVFCPRTHRYFQHRRYPLERMLAAGVRVALGTDSRASSPDLNLLAEMRHVAREYPEVAPDEVLRMATIHGARALGCESGRGVLCAGSPADLVFVAVPSGNSDPYELLFGADLPVVGTVHRDGCEFERQVS